MSKKHPSLTRDKRSKSDLELFVLALVQRDVNTPYALLSMVGLSPGATIPVLKRLEANGLIEKGRPGSRGRTEYATTIAGRKFLKAGWRPLLESVESGDMESALRTAVLAQMSGAGKKLVSAYLTRAAEAREIEAKRRREVKADKAAIEETELYRWMQSVHVSTRLGMEASVLRNIASTINRRRRSSSTSS
jgi:DNA-binding PadR family transcriptional regulator